MKLKEITKKSLASIALVSLIYVHSAITIDGMLHGFISYAINDEEVGQQQNSEEQIPEKLEILRDDQFCKTDMRNVQYEYAETIKINVNSNAIPEKILATDSSNEFFNGDELSQEEIEVNYLKTTINREQLANFLGTNGRLEIKNPETETIYCNFDASELQTLSFEEEGEVIEEVTVKDQNDEDVTASNIRLYTDKIEIEYMLAVEKLQYMVVFEGESTFEEDQYLALGLENTKQIDIIENLDDVDKIKTVIEYKELGTIAGEETVADDKTVEKETTIEERKTLAELGINQTEIPVGVEREIQLTVTLHTESIMYDLWKNPEIQIEFPEYIESIQDIDTTRVQIINNKVADNNEEETIFEISEITKENNSINIRLLGEQEEYTEQLSNIQVIIPVTIRAKKLMPSVTENISLKYTNENVTTYDNSLENGLATSILQIQAVQGIITNSKVTVGNKTSESYRSDIATLTIPSRENQEATIENIVINNKQENLSNLKIKGSSEILGEIQAQGAQVYYSNQEEIGLDTEDWLEEYFEGANKYLIVIDDLQQGGTIQFSYSSTIPEVEEDTTYKEEYTVYQNNEETVKSEIDIDVKVVHLNVSIASSVGNNTAYSGQQMFYTVTVENAGQTAVTGINIEITLPEQVTLAEENAQLTFNNLSLQPGEKIEKIVEVIVNDIEEEQQIMAKVEVTADYLEGKIEKTKINNAKETIINVSLECKPTRRNYGFGKSYRRFRVTLYSLPRK